jgi:hypothetical protein
VICGPSHVDPNYRSPEPLAPGSEVWIKVQVGGRPGLTGTVVSVARDPLLLVWVTELGRALDFFRHEVRLKVDQ